MLNTTLITSTDYDGSTIENVMIDWGNGQFSGMSLATFQSQYPNEPIPTAGTN